MKYTEKADIAAKAVKVLDSVTMNRQEPMAVRYFEQSVKAITGVSIAKCISWKSSPEDAVFTDRIEQARLAMERRLNKPRYTLKDGEWVRKGYQHNKIKPVSEILSDRVRMAQARGDTDALPYGSLKSAVAAPEHKDAQRLHNIQMSNLAGLANAYPSRIAGRASYSHSPIQAEWN